MWREEEKVESESSDGEKVRQRRVGDRGKREGRGGVREGEREGGWGEQERERGGV